MQNLTDTELIMLIRADNSTAFEALIERYQPLARHIARSIITQEELACELIQEAWLTAYLSLDQLRETTSFKGWFSRIVVNTCRRHLQRQKAQPISLDTFFGQFELLSSLTDVVDPQEVIEAQEESKDILTAIRAISPQTAIPTLLFYYEQYSVVEIAALLGISVTAVKSRLFKARKQLKKQLGPFYEVPSQKQERYLRRTVMIQITIEDVRKSLLTRQRVVTLLDCVGGRFINVRIPPDEALTIAMEIHVIAQPRITSLHFLVEVLQMTHTTLDEVQLLLLGNGIFCGVVRLRQEETHYEIKTRPAEALGLAVLMHAPITVSEEILETMGAKLPEGKTVELFWAEEVLKHLGINLPAEQAIQIAYGKLRGKDAVLKEVQQWEMVNSDRALSVLEELQQTQQQVSIDPEKK